MTQTIRQLKMTEAGARRWPALGVLGLCMLVLNLDTTIVNVALATLAPGTCTRTPASSASGLINAIRQLAGVFGVAVIGAAVASIYTARLAGRLTVLSAPQGQQVTANVANVAAVAARLGTSPAGELRTVAFAAFTHGTGIVLACCAAVARGCQ
jgi:hypothetical protein